MEATLKLAPRWVTFRKLDKKMSDMVMKYGTKVRRQVSGSTLNRPRSLSPIASRPEVKSKISVFKKNEESRRFVKLNKQIFI